ncbi:MAG: class I SAM-dependent methyltransferase [Verrucomicrobia bacterium]|nr:class I SAM-dependent methyltransferase [Verrucomicrobiota bacterium]MBV9272543.1 class I SAM-dependent methyltransferase [Verrucomicrobiota bacterium]
MIWAQSTIGAREVAGHYDELDVFYRELWGEHVHHGLWSEGSEPPEIAVKQLVDVIAEKARIKPGDQVIDIGCGYGAPARQLVDRYAANVTAVTLSPVQYAYCQSLAPGPKYLLGDWLAIDLPTRNYQAAIAVEGSEHMPDRIAFFRKAFEVLAAGGRLVVSAWITRERPSAVEISLLLRPVCDEARIPCLPSLSELVQQAKTAGFAVVEGEDYTKSVYRTWSIILKRLISRLARDRRYRDFLLDPRRQNRIFALTVLRIWLAYKVGAMRYGVITAVRGD